MNWKKKAKPEPISVGIPLDPIILGIVVDGEIVEKFSVGSPRLASLFLSNPTFTEVKS